jgi:hypothetical protein
MLQQFCVKDSVAKWKKKAEKQELCVLPVRERLSGCI